MSTVCGVDDNAWVIHDGAELEAALTVVEELGGSPVNLIDALYLIKLAEEGGKLCRRQDLPEEAFVTLQELKSMVQGPGMSLRVLVVSYPWLQPDHPDPRGETLRLLARVLKAYVEEAKDDWGGGTCGVFLDFCSLMQKGPNGEERSPPEAKLFGLALNNLSDWYSHENTIVLKLTKMPEGYPMGFTFVEGTSPNTADYYGRGWCFKESSVANLVKNSFTCLDLGKLSDATTGWFDIVEECALAPLEGASSPARTAPVTPADFAIELERKSFTSKKADLPTVAGLYKAAFEKRFGSATNLMYSGLAWDDAEVISLCKVIEGGAMPSLEELDLAYNQIGDDGMIALASTIASGALPRCTSISLDGNQATETGKKAMRDLAKARRFRVEI